MTNYVYTVRRFFWQLKKDQRCKSRLRETETGGCCSLEEVKAVWLRLVMVEMERSEVDGSERTCRPEWGGMDFS